MLTSKSSIDHGGDQASASRATNKPAHTVSPHAVNPDHPTNTSSITTYSQLRMGQDGTGSSARPTLVKKDTRQQQLAEYLKAQNTNNLGQRPSMESSRLDDLLREHYAAAGESQRVIE